MSTAPESIQITEYWSNNGVMILREALPEDHPEHPYNYIKTLYKVDPSEYGIPKPAKLKGIRGHVID